MLLETERFSSSGSSEINELNEVKQIWAIPGVSFCAINSNLKYRVVSHEGPAAFEVGPSVVGGALRGLRLKAMEFGIANAEN